MVLVIPNRQTFELGLLGCPHAVELTSQPVNFFLLLTDDKSLFIHRILQLAVRLFQLVHFLLYHTLIRLCLQHMYMMASVIISGTLMHKRRLWKIRWTCFAACLCDDGR
jgi:hypothetical protein